MEKKITYNEALEYEHDLQVKQIDTELEDLPEEEVNDFLKFAEEVNSEED